MKYLIILLLFSVLAISCKTRKVTIDKLKAEKKSQETQQSHTQETKKESTTDKGIETKTTVKQAESKSSAKLSVEADSIVQTTDKTGKKKLTIFPTKGKRFEVDLSEESRESVNELLNKQNDIKTDKAAVKDSSGFNSKKITEKSDESHKSIKSELSGKTIVYILITLFTIGFIVYWFVLRKYMK